MAKDKPRYYHSFQHLGLPWGMFEVTQWVEMRDIGYYKPERITALNYNNGYTAYRMEEL